MPKQMRDTGMRAGVRASEMQNHLISRRVSMRVCACESNVRNTHHRRLLHRLVASHAIEPVTVSQASNHSKLLQQPAEHLPPHHRCT